MGLEGVREDKSSILYKLASGFVRTESLVQSHLTAGKCRTGTEDNISDVITSAISPALFRLLSKISFLRKR